MSLDNVDDKTFNDLVKQSEALDKLGKKFLSDRTKLENTMQKIENANISDSEKSALKEELEAAMERLEEKYDADVAAGQEELKDEMDVHLENLESEKSEKAKVVRELEDESDGGESGALHVTETVNKAKEQQAEFEKIYSAQAERIKLQKQRAEAQHKEMMKKQLSK